jgi:RNA polymerase sigma factor (sigma-70 family)
MGPTRSLSEVDVDLALRLMEDDESALVEVLRHYGPGIELALRGKYELFTRQDAEDVLALALMRLWESRASYDETRGSLRTYFYRIADHAACDVFKYGWHKARQREVDYGKENDLDSITSGQPATDCGSHEGDKPAKKKGGKQEKRLRDLKEIVDSLPEKHRHIIWSDACAKDEVADAGQLGDELEIAAGSVRVYRKRAMEAIRKKMRERGHQVP